MLENHNYQKLHFGKIALGKYLSASASSLSSLLTFSSSFEILDLSNLTIGSVSLASSPAWLLLSVTLMPSRLVELRKLFMRCRLDDSA